MDRQRLIQVARGECPADLVLTNTRIVNVFSGEIESRNVAISQGHIAGFDDYDAIRTMDMDGSLLAPGFIDPHVHIESAMACISEFTRAILPLGTTSVIADPHEIANVLGLSGIRYMLNSAEGQLLNIWFTLPSCVPATDMETAGARLEARDLLSLIDENRIVGLGEMMNFPGVIAGAPDVLKKIEIVQNHRKALDGHAPGLTGKPLYAYASAGITSDHECTSAREARQKLRAGMHIMIREGTGAKNLKQLLPLVTERTCHRVMWCTDDRHPHDLLNEGHINAMIKDAVRSGLDPVMAIRMATLNPSEYYGLKNVGAIAPGRRADLVVLSDLSELRVEQVFSNGSLVAENGKLLPHIELPTTIPAPASMHLSPNGVDLAIAAHGDRIRLIDLITDQIATRQVIERASVSKGFAVADPQRDILKLAVVERHRGTGNIGIGFVRGFGLKSGALASSVAHDSHNIIVVGVDDRDMQAAVSDIVSMGGGITAVQAGRPLARLPLPIAGLMSAEPVQKIRQCLDELIQASHAMGCRLTDPFMSLSFLALPVIPELKLTDKGLVDVKRFEIVPLFVE